RNCWWIAIARKETLGPRYFITHIVGSCFQIDTQLKLYSDTRKSLTTLARERSYARNSINILLERLRNLIFDDVGIGTRIRNLYCNKRVIYTWKLSNAQVA